MKRNPINLKQWIEAHRDELKPPVGNRCIHDEGDFIVMIVGGPNSRADFHVNDTEELFFQVEGDIELHTMQDEQRVITPIREGELFLLPANTPHLPIRPANTVGLVVEMVRPETTEDEFRWYCNGCGYMLYHERVHVADIVEQLPIVFDHFYEDEDKRTCEQCGDVFAKPESARHG